MNGEINTDKLKNARIDFEIHELIKRRWSPVAFGDRPVDKEELRSLFEAARWAPSSYNEQPWFYMLATRDRAAEFEKLLSCLVDGNKKWARFAAALALGIVRTNFSRNGKSNHHAFHDLGAASAILTLEATARGLYVHQMAGILPDRAREIYSIPESYEIVTGMAIGYLGDGSDLAEDIRKRDRTPRRRRKLTETIFEGSWGETHSILAV